MGGSVYSKDTNTTNNEDAFKRCTRGMIIEARPYVIGEALPESITIKPEDRASGSPTAGDMIARDPHRKNDPHWLIAKEDFDLYTMVDLDPAAAVAAVGDEPVTPPVAG